MEDLRLARHVYAYIDVLGSSGIFSNKDVYASELFLSLMDEAERRLSGMRHENRAVNFLSTHRGGLVCYSPAS
jgi:hypothetical protein